MGHRTPTSHHDDQPTAELTGLLCGHEERRFGRAYVCVRDPHRRGRHDMQTAEYAAEVAARRHADVTEAKRLVAEERARLAAPAPTGAASEVDPPPATSAHSEAATPDDAVGTASETTAVPLGSASVGSGGTAGAGRPQRDELGRFIGRSRQTVPAQIPTSVALEHALIDVDAALFLADQHRRLEMGRTVLDAIRFGVEADRLETAMATYAGMLVRLGHDGGGRP